ncbi:Hypothetical protein FKW44_002329 [Caligus rogercresseyi]|uniref:Uncharacterized protein n=1 Tax=Caligus rogercresseyi TaxID=217165 RepID=A0A7T8QW87_CALRO|nr:Hypothetical protein FKW44_002329 [Caligus rogercresseyi]
MSQSIPLPSTPHPTIQYPFITPPFSTLHLLFTLAPLVIPPLLSTDPLFILLL